jgi:23S rRNA-intervening sequence protein
MTDSSMGDFAKLEVWERAHRLVLRVYKVTEHFPASENWGLVAQLRRAAISVPSNIAEGCGRTAARPRLEYLPQSQADEIMREITGIRGMLSSLCNRLKSPRPVSP